MWAVVVRGVGTQRVTDVHASGGRNMCRFGRRERWRYTPSVCAKADNMTDKHYTITV